MCHLLCTYVQCPTQCGTHSCGQNITIVRLISLKSNYSVFHYTDSCKESFTYIDQTSKQAHFTNCVQQNLIFVCGYEVQRNTGSVFVETCIRKKILEMCHSEFVCWFPAVLNSSISTVQELVNKFLTGCLLEKNREYTTCSFIRNIGLYRNTYRSIVMVKLICC